MDFEEKLIASVVSLVFGLFIFPPIFLPISFFLARRASKDKPESALPPVVMITAGAFMVFYISIFIFAMLMAI